MNGFEIKAKAKEATIFFYGLIGDEWDGITDKAFAKELKSLGNVNRIDARFNSDGGNVFQGATIYNLLRQHSAVVTSFIDGIAASIASVMALAGDKVVMGEGSTYMIHDPWTLAIGNSSDLRKMADILDVTRDNIASIYASKTGLGLETINQLMNEETWMKSDQAIELGFVDEIFEAPRVAAKVHKSLIHFQDRVPEYLEIDNTNGQPVSFSRYVEDAQRAGFINSQTRNDFPRLAASGEYTAKMAARLRKHKI